MARQVIMTPSGPREGEIPEGGGLGGWNPATGQFSVTGGAPLMPAPGGNVAEPPAFDWGTDEPWGGGAGDLPSQPFGPEGFPDFSGRVWNDPAWQSGPGAGSYTGGPGGTPPGAEKNESGRGPGSGGGGLRPGAAVAPLLGAKSPQDQMLQAQNREFFNRVMQMLLSGGPGGAFSPAAVPDFRAEAMRQAELMRRRAGQRGVEEAAATGGAGSRDLAYRQSLLDEALFNAGGNIGAEQAGRQFQANLQAKSLEAQQEIARFNQLLKMLSVLTSMQG